MADVINLSDYRPAGNGAREALIAMFTLTNVSDPENFADCLLAEMWLRGFKIVPLEPGD